MDYVVLLLNSGLYVSMRSFFGLEEFEDQSAIFVSVDTIV